MDEKLRERYRIQVGEYFKTIMDQIEQSIGFEATNESRREIKTILSFLPIIILFGIICKNILINT